jgi:molybdate transport system substrate-binding protein
MVGYALDDLIKQGKVIPDSRVELADSRIGMVVREGAAKPDISSVEGLKQVLLHAKSIAYSDSASGVYIERELFKKLGIEEQVKAKAKMIPRIPVASVVATGDYEIGFQQVSELLPIKGIAFVGVIPKEVQKVTRYSAGIPIASKEAAAAQQLIAYIVGPVGRSVVNASGLEPLTGN